VTIRDAITVLALVALAAVLRFHQYDQIPYPSETADEYAYAWSGWSWLHEGSPTSWSEKAAYGVAPVYIWNGARYRLVHPWYDHPPLYGLIAGAAASVVPADDLMDASLSVVRLVSVAAGALSVGLLFALALSTFGYGVALSASALLATVPTIVLTSRLALAESLIVPLLLLGLIGAWRWSSSLSQRPRVWLALTCCCAFAAPLAKAPGLVVAVSAALLLVLHNRTRAAVVVAVAGCAGLIPYVAFGLVTTPSIFRAVVADQAGRATGLETLARLITSNSVVSVQWNDSWMAFLWIALGYATLRRDRTLTALAFPYLVFLVAAVDQQALRGWYREPLYPALCLAGGILIRDTLARPDAIRTALLLFGVAFGKLAEGLDGWALLAQVPGGQRLFPLAIACLAAVLVAATAWPRRGWVGASRALVFGSLVTAIAVSVATVWRADELYPSLRPSDAIDALAPTGSGLVLTRYSLAPAVLPPGGWIRVHTDWFVDRDAGESPVGLYARPFDRKRNEYGPYVQLAGASALTMTGGEQATLELEGRLPTEPGDADWEISLGASPPAVRPPIALGIVRAKANPRVHDSYQAVGSIPVLFGDSFALNSVLVVQSRTTAAGTVIPLALRLEARHTLNVDYHLFIHVVDENGIGIAQSDGLPGGRTGPRLRVGEEVTDWRDVVVPAATRPGTYYLTAGLYELSSGRRLPVAGGDSVRLGVVQVGVVRSGVSAIGARFAGGIELVGWDGSTIQDGVLRTNLYWRTNGPLPRDYTVFVHLVGEDGRPLAQADGPPDLGRVPTSTWRPEQVIKDPRAIDLRGVEPGRYRLLVGLYEPPDGPRVAVAGRDDGAVEIGGVIIP
jgi:hypothetical protein